MKFRAEQGQRIRVATWVMASLLVCGCMPDAQRDNPYDPKSDIYLEGDAFLSGNVRRLYPPYDGIQGVIVVLSTPGGSAVTGPSGAYSLPSIPPGSYIVMARKEGYETDSIAIEFAADEKYTLDFSLDALPSVSNPSVTSEHGMTLPSIDYFSIGFDVQVDDDDGASDVESVAVSVAAFGFQRRLDRILNTSLFHLTVSPEEITTDRPETLVGKEAIFTAWDRIGHQTPSEPQRLVRIIYSSPSVVTPNEEEKMDDRRLLVWGSFADSVDFAFTYTIDIESAFSSGWNRTGIPQDSTTVAVTGSLDIHSIHRWSVWAVDEYGNTSKSPYMTFSIEGGK